MDVDKQVSTGVRGRFSRAVPWAQASFSGDRGSSEDIRQLVVQSSLSMADLGKMGVSGRARGAAATGERLHLPPLVGPSMACRPRVSHGGGKDGNSSRTSLLVDEAMGFSGVHGRYSLPPEPTCINFMSKGSSGGRVDSDRRQDILANFRQRLKARKSSQKL